MDPARSTLISMHKLPAALTGTSKLNINDLPMELLIKILSRVSSDTPWRMVELGLVCRSWYAVTKHSSAFWANVVSNEWRFPAVSAISLPAPRARFLKTYASALERSLPYYLAVSLDISPFLELTVLGPPKSTLLWTLAPHSKRLVSLSLVVTLDDTLQQFHDFLSLDLIALEELSLTTPPLDLAYATDAVAVPLPVPEDIEYKSLPSSALPHLQSLRVTGSLYGPWLARPSLKHLRIVGNGDATALITDRMRTGGLLFGGLKDCPALETLEIDNTLPVWTMSYEAPIVKAWPHSHALQKLRSCIVRDSPEWVVKFITYLHNAPLPVNATLDVTHVPPQPIMSSQGAIPGSSLSTDQQISFFTENLCALAFRQPTDGPEDSEPIRMELNTMLRVYTGDRKRLELKFSPELRKLFIKRFGLVFAEALVTQIAMNEQLARKFDDRTLRPEIAELVVDFGAHLTDQHWWRQFFWCFGHARRLEVRARDAAALFWFLSGMPEDERHLTQAERFTLLLAQRRLTSDEFPEEFSLLGVDFRMQDSDEGEIAKMVVDAFAMRKAEGRQVPRKLTVRYRGHRRPTFEERVMGGLEGVVRCVVVASS